MRVLLLSCSNWNLETLVLWVEQGENQQQPQTTIWHMDRGQRSHRCTIPAPPILFGILPVYRLIPNN